MGRYVRDQQLFNLERAMHKMTGLSAQTFNLTDRGFVRKGYWADLVLFDPATIEEMAIFDDPEQPARGINTVLVNGTMTWPSGAPRATGRMFFWSAEGLTARSSDE